MKSNFLKTRKIKLAIYFLVEIFLRIFFVFFFFRLYFVWFFSAKCGTNLRYVWSERKGDTPDVNRNPSLRHFRERNFESYYTGKLAKIYPKNTAILWKCHTGIIPNLYWKKISPSGLTQRTSTLSWAKTSKIYQRWISVERKYFNAKLTLNLRCFFFAQSNGKQYNILRWIYHLDSNFHALSRSARVDYILRKNTQNISYLCAIFKRFRVQVGGTITTPNKKKLINSSTLILFSIYYLTASERARTCGSLFTTYISISVLRLLFRALVVHSGVKFGINSSISSVWIQYFSMGQFWRKKNWAVLRNISTRIQLWGNAQRE